MRYQNKVNVSDLERDDLRDRLIKLETIIGDDNRGVLAELKSLRITVENLNAAIGVLREFQIKVLTAFGMVAIAIQVIIQVLLK
jgi:hypothetical protein